MKQEKVDALINKMAFHSASADKLLDEWEAYRNQLSKLIIQSKPMLAQVGNAEGHIFEMIMSVLYKEQAYIRIIRRHRRIAARIYHKIELHIAKKVQEDAKAKLDKLKTDIDQLQGGDFSPEDFQVKMFGDKPGD